MYLFVDDVLHYRKIAFGRLWDCAAPQLIHASRFRWLSGCPHLRHRACCHARSLEVHKRRQTLQLHSDCTQTSKKGPDARIVPLTLSIFLGFRIIHACVGAMHVLPKLYRYTQIRWTMGRFQIFYVDGVIALKHFDFTVKHKNVDPLWRSVFNNHL
jgi:hypothetical protein